jgi:hypothetical protein
MKAFILLVVICMALTNAFAQTNKKKGGDPKPTTQAPQQRLWESEPESILGIKLGLPLSESMDECPKGEYGYEYQSGKVCWKKQYQDLPWYYEIQNHPTPGLAIWDVSVWVVEGSVESVDFKFNHYDYLNMAELLKSKYGPPSQEKVATVQNRMGATFDSLEMTWTGRNLTLTFESRAGKIDEGMVHIYSKKYSESNKFNAEQYKDKL